MQRSAAVVLGAVALALVILQGMLQRQEATDVLADAIVAMMVFMIAGAFVGWVIDHLVQIAVETQFRRRLDEYRKELEPDGQRKREPAAD